MKNRIQSTLKPVTLAVAAFILAGCSSLNPNPLEDKAVRDRASDDRVKMFDQQEPITAAITMEEAIARALKYNLDLRLKKMEVDARVAAVAKSGVSSKAETELELVRATARSAVSKYQRAIAYANAQAAYARIQHSLGQDFDFGDFDNLTVSEVAANVSKTLADTEKQLPTPLLAKAGPRPKVQLHLDEQQTGKSLLAGVSQGLSRGGFDVVGAEQADALKLQVSLKMADAAKGLKKGEVVLSEVGKQSASYTATLPQEPRETTYNAMGEAAITANVGNLREWIANNSK